MSARLEYTSEHRQFREWSRLRAADCRPGARAVGEGRLPGPFAVHRSRQAWAAGLFVPEEFGGAGVEDFRYNAIVVDELQRAGAAAEAIGLSLQNDIVLPYLTDLTTPQQKQRWLPGVVTGETVIGIAMTEPGAGSDLAGIRTTAVRDGDHYVLNGAKTFISNGQTGDLFVVAARTGPTGTRVVAARRRPGCAWLQPRPESGQDRPARPGHQRTQLHRCAGFGRRSTRRGRPGLLPVDEQPAAGAAVAGRRRGGRRRGRLGRDAGLRQAAQGFWLSHFGLAEYSVRTRRAGDGTRYRAYLPRRLHRRTSDRRADCGAGGAAEMVDHRTSGTYR